MIPFGYWFTFANTHEIASMKPGDGVDGRAGRIPVGDHFKALARNKYWWLTLGLNFALWTYNASPTAWPPTSPSTCSATPI